MSGPSALEVKRVTPDDSIWDRFVEAHPTSTFAHLAGWRRVFGDVLRHETIYLAAVDTGGIWQGALPLVRVRGLPGHYLVSLPFLNDGGPIGTPGACALLVAEAVKEAMRSGAKLLELRNRGTVPGGLPASHRKIAVHLALPETVERLWSETFKAKLRSQIRRPAKEGMVVRAGQDQLDAFYRVFARNMRDLGTPVLGREFFECVAETFGGSVRFSAVYTREGSPVAAGCCLVWRDEMEIVWASSLREHNRFSPNMLLYADAMEEAIARGVRRFNFGRSTPGAPTHRFKQQWGGEDVPLPWVYWSSAGNAATPSPDKPIFRAATAVWRRLPVALTNRLGPSLARQLP